MTQAKKTKDEEEPTAEVEATEAEEPSGPSGPELVPPSQPEQEPKEVAGGNVADDGVEDVELGPPVVGQWVQITGGDYAGRFAAYLGNVSMEADDDPSKPAVIQVRTRDADNLVLDVPYADVAATTYSGGR